MIRISKLADYAVVMLTSMAQERGVVLSAPALSERTRISEPTVAKVLKMLSRQGIVLSVRGAAGGYRLARPADQIAVIDIVEAIEGPIALTACVDGAEPDCALGACCSVRGRWYSVNQAMRSALEEVMLADMIAPARIRERKGAGYGGH